MPSTPLPTSGVDEVPFMPKPDPSSIPVKDVPISISFAGEQLVILED
jgi:hypothetical protein